MFKKEEGIRALNTLLSGHCSLSLFSKQSAIIIAALDASPELASKRKDQLLQVVDCMPKSSRVAHQRVLCRQKVAEAP